MTEVSSIFGDAQHSLALVGADLCLTRQISGIASKARWRVIECENPAQIEARFDAEANTQVSVILVEGTSAAETLKLISKVKSCRPNVPVVAIASPSSVIALAQMLRAGANGFLTKPLSAEQLLHCLRGIETGALPDDLELLPFQEERDGCIKFASIVGNDRSFRAVLARAAMAARGHGHVLIGGECGTGKKTLARAMHAASPRAALPFRLIDLRKLAPANVVPTLWGHERGAFPGAFEQRAGILLDCDGGTLVLDGIDRLPASHQQNLAKTIRLGCIHPLGANYGFRANIRILAISHRPLSDLVESGAVLADLYNLLSDTRLTLPPLRKRHGDVALLARHFLAKFVNEANLNELSLSQDAVALLEAYHWPANLRQLQSTILRGAVASEDGVITSRNFPNLLRAFEDSRGSNWLADATFLGLDSVNLYTNDGHIRTLSEIESDVIRLSTKHYRGQMSEAARRLGIGRSTLYRKLAELGLEDS